MLLLIACNTRSTGTGMLLAPQAQLDDGLVDVIIVRQASRWQICQLFRRVFDGTHLDLPFVEHYQVSTFSIESPLGDRLNIDGELVGTTPFEAQVLPDAVQVYC